MTRPITFIDETDPLGPPADSSVDTPLSAANLNAMQDGLMADTVAQIALTATNGQVGATAPGAPGFFMSNIVATASRAYAVRLVPRRNLTVVKIGFVTTLAATNDDACDVGIYASDLATKLVSAGATTGKMNATAGPQSITVSSTALTAGTTYYLAFSYGTVGGTAGRLLMADYNSIANAPAIYGNTAGKREMFTKAASHPLPASLTSADATTTQAPMLTALES